MSVFSELQQRKCFPINKMSLKMLLMDKNIERLEASVGDIITDIDGNLSEAEDGGDSRKKPALDLHALAEAALKMLEED